MRRTGSGRDHLPLGAAACGELRSIHASCPGKRLGYAIPRARLLHKELPWKALLWGARFITQRLL